MDSVKGIKKVYIIYDPVHFTQAKIWNDILDEGFSYNFWFYNEMTRPIDIEKLENADEVWCWGDCTLISDYIMAREYGSEIWVMG